MQSIAKRRGIPGMIVNFREFFGGDFISHFDDESEGRVEYEFNLQEPGDYFLWLRSNPVQSRIDFQLNNGDWKSVSLDGNKDSINFAADGRPDLRFIAWISTGAVCLPVSRCRILH